MSSKRPPQDQAGGMSKEQKCKVDLRRGLIDPRTFRSQSVPPPNCSPKNKQLYLLRNFRNLSEEPELFRTERCGLFNEAVDCYMNSIIQCLASLPVLVKYLANGFIFQHLDDPLNPTSLSMDFAALLIRLGRSKVPLIPFSFKKTLSKWPIYHPLIQQDAQEFLMYLLDNIHEECRKPLIEQGNELCFKANANRSIIVDLFEGMYKSSVTCQTCRHSSIKFEAFTQLSMDIPVAKEKFQFYYFSMSGSITKVTLYVYPDYKFGDLYLKFSGTDFITYWVQGFNAKRLNPPNDCSVFSRRQEGDSMMALYCQGLILDLNMILITPICLYR